MDSWDEACEILDGFEYEILYYKHVPATCGLLFEVVVAALGTPLNVSQWQPVNSAYLVLHQICSKERRETQVQVPLTLLAPPATKRNHSLTYL